MLTHITIQGQQANLSQWIVLMRPNFSHVENVPPVLLSVGWVHDLNEDLPLGVVPSVNGLEHVSDHVVRVFACNAGSLLGSEILDSLLRLDVNFDVLE
jgi:hypothetical protein